MKINRLFISVFIICVLIVSCSNDDDDLNDNGSEIVIDEDFETNSKDTVFADAIYIDYSDEEVSISNPFENDGVTVALSKGNVVVTSTNTSTEINYVLSGAVNDGSLKIYSDYKFGLVLNGVSIISANGPAINIQSGKKATVTLIKGTSSRLVDGTTYTEVNNEDMKATFFSEGQLVFEGDGDLLVIGRYKHGITSDDYIRINSGNITISSAVKDGVHCNDYFRMDGGTLKVTALSDGIECEEGYVEINGGNITVNSVDDAIVSSYSGTDASITPYVTINGGNINIITSGQKGAGIKSKASTLTINGGTLNVEVQGVASKALNSGGDMNIVDGNITLTTTGDAYYDSSESDTSSAAGIKCKSNLVIQNGTMTLVSSGSGGKGINVDGTIVIDNGTISVTTTGDQYVYSRNLDTAAKAIKSTGNLTVNGGGITIKTSKTEAEGLESKATLTINGGTLDIQAYDDCINASKHIQINGGNIYCYSTTNDGVDSNGTLTVTGGVVVSSGTTSPEEGFDCDNNTFKITGGILVGTGGSTSTPTSGVSTQRSVVYGAGSVSSGQCIQVTSSSGDVLVYKVPRAYSSMTMLFSTPNLVSGTTYSIVKGVSISGGTDFNGLYTRATCSGGTTAYTFNPTSMVTSVGSTGGNNGGGGGRP